MKELVVLVETGLSTAPIEKLTCEPAVKLLVWNPFLAEILPPDTVQVMAVWKPATDAQDAAVVVGLLILISDGISTVTYPFCKIAFCGLKANVYVVDTYACKLEGVTENSVKDPTVDTNNELTLTESTA